jgi:hypothetical protein
MAGGIRGIGLRRHSLGAVGAGEDGCPSGNGIGQFLPRRAIERLLPTTSLRSDDEDSRITYESLVHV